MTNREAAEYLDKRVMNIAPYGEWKEVVEMAISALEKQIQIGDLPSAQAEIVRCKECKYWHREIYNNIEYFNYSSCDLNHGGDGHNFYCADAERRTDGV